MAKNSSRVPVSERAAAQRIQRKLAQTGEKLVKLRGPAADVMGRWVVVDATGKTTWACDLEEFGRQLGALRPYEEIV